jgi:NADH:ubiquinone oxidoreductase subunit K
VIGHLFSRAPVENLMVLAAFIFSCGVYTILSRRNAVAVLMGLELVLNAANLNLVALSQYTTAGSGGNVFALFVILIAAAEAAVALGIVVAIYRTFGRVDVDRATLMKG